MNQLGFCGDTSLRLAHNCATHYFPLGYSKGGRLVVDASNTHTTILQLWKVRLYQTSHQTPQQRIQ